jgi:hypothetical protein
MLLDVIRNAHGRRIRFDENTICGKHGVEFAETSFAGLEKSAIEGEVGAEFCESSGQFAGAAVRVKQKATLRKWRGAKHVVKRAESIEAMNRSGKISLRCKGELPAKHLDLFLDQGATETNQTTIVGPCTIENPAIKADLADGRIRMFVEMVYQFLLPAGGTISDLPWVQAKTWKQAKLKPTIVRSQTFGTLNA